MPPLIIAGVIVAAAAVGSAVAGRAASSAARDAAQKATDKATSIIADLNLPPDQAREVILQQYKEAGILSPEVEEEIHAQFANIGNEDPKLRNAQLEALEQYKERAHGGMNAEDRLAMSQAKEVAARENTASTNDIMRQMQQRGQGGAGAELAAKLQASQANQNELSRSSERTAATANQRALDALKEGTSLASNMRQQEQGALEKQQAAQNEYNRFDTQNQIAMQQRNVASKNRAAELNLNNEQDVLNKNTNQSNQELLRQRAGEQSDYINKVNLAEKKAAAEQNRAANYLQQAADTQKYYASIGEGIGKGAAVVGGGMTGGAAPSGMTAQNTQTLPANNASNKMNGTMYAAHGGKVPGNPVMPGDHPANDTVDAELSPGEIVVPRTVADGSDDHILGFIKGLRASYNKTGKMFLGGTADSMQLRPNSNIEYQKVEPASDAELMASMHGDSIPYSSNYTDPYTQLDQSVPQLSDEQLMRSQEGMVYNSENPENTTIPYAPGIIPASKMSDKDLLTFLDAPKKGRHPAGNRVSPVVPDNNIRTSQEAPTSRPSLSDEPEDQSELRAAQQQSRNMKILAGLTDAAETIAGGISRIEPSHGASKIFAQNADIPMEEYKARQTDLKGKQELKKSKVDLKMGELGLQKAQGQLNDDDKLRDPNAEISVLARSIMKKAGYPISEKASAKDLKDQGLDLDKIIGYVSKKEDTALKREELKSDKDKKQTDKMSSDQNSFILKASDKLIKHGDTVSKINQGVEMLKEAVANPSAVKDVAGLYSIIKDLDPGSTVREGEVGLLRQTQSILGNLKADLSRASANPQLLTPEVRKQMLEAALQLQKNATSEYNKRRDVYLKQAKSRQISEDRFNEIDPYYQGQSQQPQSQMIKVRRKQDGKEVELSAEKANALFNSPNSEQYEKVQ